MRFSRPVSTSQLSAVPAHDERCKRAMRKYRTVSATAKPLTGPRACQEQNNCSDQRRDVASKIELNAFSSSSIERYLERFSESHLLTQPLVNENVRVHGKSNRQNNAVNAWQRKNEMKHRSAPTSKIRIDDQGEICDETGNFVVDTPTHTSVDDQGRPNQRECWREWSLLQCRRDAPLFLGYLQAFAVGSATRSPDPALLLR